MDFVSPIGPMGFPDERVVAPGIDVVGFYTCRPQTHCRVYVWGGVDAGTVCMAIDRSSPEKVDLLGVKGGLTLDSNPIVIAATIHELVNESPSG